jgi:hypothetical protein
MSSLLGCLSLPSMMYLTAPLMSPKMLWMTSLALAAVCASSWTWCVLVTLCRRAHHGSDSRIPEGCLELLPDNV